MAHTVTCTICHTKFDRDKMQYVITGIKRYAHADCALRQAANQGADPPEVINPLDNVECIYCKSSLNRKDEDCVMIRNGKYAHKHCADLESKRELTDEEKLDNYIMKMFGTDYVHQKVKKQINTYIKEYNYSYSGILKTLIYFYEIKGNPIEKANGGIGIVPYVYQDAYRYFYALWEAKQKNKGKVMENYVPEDVIITIPPPQRNIKKRKFFSFLDDEEEPNGE